MSKHDRFSPRHSRHDSKYRALRHENLEDRRLLAVVTVDTNLDVVDFTDGVTSLREAIFATNLVAGADEIQFDFGHDGPETIVLTLGELAITDSLTITGPGAELLTIDASGNDPTPDENNGDGSRVLFINDGSTATQIDVKLRGLTLTGGDVSGGGGAIFSRENLLVTLSTISGNSAGRNGGGIHAGGTTTITGSTISGNLTGSYGGGGIYASESITIAGSTVSGNSADRDGGGIWAFDTTTIIDSTISGNSADRNGGGIYARFGMMTTITGSTISGNSARKGGGIHAVSTMTIAHSTISGNSTFETGLLAVDRGGGIYARSGTVMTITASTISDNSTGHRGSGGGIWANGTTTITDSAILGNTARYGGGISGSGQTTIIGSTISDNSAGTNSGGIWVNGTTIITDSTISGNSAGRNGGGIHAGGTTTITGSTISGNSAGRFGGGGGIWADDPMTIADSTISGNSAGSVGGGIVARDTTTITDSTISDNTANLGGGIFSRYGTTTITGSTISGNSARTNGGGIWTDGTTTITGSTISGNSAGNNGGGIYFGFRTVGGTISHSTIVDNISDADQSGAGSGGGLFVRSGTLSVDHTIVAQNTDHTSIGRDMTGFIEAVFDVHFSLIGDNTGSGLAEAPVGLPDAQGNLIGDPTGSGIINPLLGPLADNGGPTLTHALLIGSPAINRGDLNDVAGVGGVPLFDQRGDGFPRIFSGRIDIGAYELQEFSDLNLLVDTLDDESDGDFSRFDLSLREAIELANANPAPDTIYFDPALSGGTILLTMGELAITDSVEILGLGADQLTIDASGNDPTPDASNGDGSRVFNIDDGSFVTSIDVELRGLTLTGGDVSSDGGAIFSQEENLSIIDSTISGNSAGNSGGGIWAYSRYSSPTTITNSTITGNSAGFFGGGIAAGGTTTITNSNISGNSAYVGGGITASDRVTVINSTISGNSAAAAGGIFVNFGPMTITGSTISGNSATTIGGGIHVNIGPLTITDSTISGNSAGLNGGGIFEEMGGTTISASTISGNSADNNGGGIFFLVGGTISHSTITGNISDADRDGSGAGGGVFVNTGTLSVDHTIVAQNKKPPFVGQDITGFLGSVLEIHFSLIGTNTGTGLAAAPVGSPDPNGNLIGGPTNSAIDPLLGPLADNGGPTQTHALLADSPAIDAGDPALVAGTDGTPKHDQRGFPYRRIFGARIDIGAIESQPLPGDFDGDGDADRDDLAQWEADYGLNGNSDADGDGQTSGIDFLAWQITQGIASSASGQETLASESAITVASDFSTNARLEPRLVDAALAVALSETDHFSLGRRPAGRRDAVVVDEVFQRTDFVGPPASPTNGPVTRFSHHLLDSRQSMDTSQELSEALLEAELVEEIFALL